MSLLLTIFSVLSITTASPISTEAAFGNPLSLTEPALIESSSQTKSSSILIPLYPISSPTFKAFGGDLDPFDTSNATVCWKQKHCAKVRLSQEEIDILEYSYFMDDSMILNFPVNEYKTKCNWVECPASMPVQCGLGCAASLEACQEDIYRQISSVAEVAFNVGQIILSVLSTTTGGLLHSTGLKHWLSEASERVAVEAVKHYLSFKVGKQAADQLAEQIIGRAVGKDSIIDWNVSDPTGVSEAIKIFWKPMCPVSTPAVSAVSTPTPSTVSEA